MNAQQLIDAAKMLTPSIRERGRSTELARRVPDETFKALHEAELFRMLQPLEFGGHQMDLKTFFEISMILSAADGSTGWVYSVLASHALLVARMNPQAAKDVWGEDPAALVGAAAMARGGVISKQPDGSYKASGRWGFASGCHGAQWCFVGGIDPQSPQDGLVFLLVPARDFTIDDNWNVMGFCGTGSCDVLVDAVIPAHRVLFFQGAPRPSDPAIYKPQLSVFLPHVATYPLVGIAQGSIDEYLTSQASRSRFLGGPVSDEPLTRLKVAESAADVDAAKVTMAVNWEQYMELLENGTPVPPRLIARMGRDQGRAVRLAVSAVNRIFANAGGRALTLDNPLQRAFRDVHAGAAHAGNQWDQKLITFGAFEFGVPADQLML